MWWIRHCSGVGSIAFGGLTCVELLQVFELLSHENKIRAMDVCEVNPNYDVLE